MSKLSKLSEVADVIDSLHKTPKYADVGRPMVRCTDVKYGRLDLSKTFKVNDEVFAEFSRRYTPKREDIIITRVGSYGITAIVEDKNFCLGQNTSVVVPKINPRYLYLALNSPYIKNQIEFSVVGSTQKTLSLKAINNLDIPRFDPDVEGKIAEIIGDLDDKIELNRQTNQTLEQIAQAIFKSWFVDFEPVKAKIQAKQEWARSMTAKDGGNDENAGAIFVERAAMCAISGKSLEELEQLSPETQQQLKTTAALFPNALVESELGKIPEGWKITELGEILEFNPKRTLKKGALAPYLDMKNVPTQGHLADDVYLREMASGTKFINGDTLLARITPCLENGKTAYVDFLENDQVAWGSTEYIVIHPKNERPMSLGYIIARFDTFRSKAIQTMTGTSGRQRANAKALAEQLWIDYPIELLEKFDSIAGGYLAKAKLNGDENKTLSDLRDVLLPKFLSGELELNTTQTALEKTA